MSQISLIASFVKSPRSEPIGSSAPSPGPVYAFGLRDGTNSGAYFNTPTGIAADHSGNLFVADAGNNAIRKVTPVTGTTNWVVTTIAGQGPNNRGIADGTNTAARFF